MKKINNNLNYKLIINGIKAQNKKVGTIINSKWKVIKVFKKISSNKSNIINKQKIGNKPKIGDKVKIIIKPYNKKIIKSGIVKRVLTKKKFHSRGHKVELKNGTVGRII